MTQVHHIILCGGICFATLCIIEELTKKTLSNLSMILTTLGVGLIYTSIRVWFGI